MNKKKKIINEYNILGVNIQILLTIALVIIGVIVILTNKYYVILEFVAAADLLVMALNNNKIFHKKNITWIYLIVAILLILVGILSLTGVLK